jgi:hypothetical protein
MERSLLKHLPQLIRTGGHELSRPFESAIPLVSGLLQGRDLLWSHPIFALRVVSGFHFDLTKSDDIGTADNADVIASGGGSEPLTQVFLCIRNSESLHRVFIESVKSFANRPKKIQLRHIGNCLKADPVYSKGIASALGITLSEVARGKQSSLESGSDINVAEKDTRMKT